MFIILKFLKNHGQYTPGDVAGFKEVAAQEYLTSGVAELITPTTVAEVVPVAPESADVGDAVQAAVTPAARRGRSQKS